MMKKTHMIDEEQETERAPDQIVADRILSPNVSFESLDDDLEYALSLSRKEYFEYIEKQERDEKERQRLAQQLAVPLSRLRLWRQHVSPHSHDAVFLDYIMDTLQKRLGGHDPPPSLDTELHHDFSLFLGSMETSSVFHIIVPLCRLPR